MKTFVRSAAFLSFFPLIAASFLLIPCNATASGTDAAESIGDPVPAHRLVSTGLDLASISANATAKTVFINWVTASEADNNYFEVERSIDNKNFKTVALLLDGFAAEGTGKSYKFKEDAGEVKKGKTVYYRLKLVNQHNEVYYSDVLPVQLKTALTNTGAKQ